MDLSTAVVSDVDLSQSPSFNVKSARELVRKSAPARLVFALLFGSVSILVLPWWIPVPWIVFLFAWELANGAALDWMVMHLDEGQAIPVFALSNALGSIYFSFLALMALSTVTPIGVAIGAIWFAGSYTNAFTYFGEKRVLLLSVLLPMVGSAIIGPMLFHPPSLASVAISALILTGLVASRGYSIDHRILLKRLAQWQQALADVEGKLSIAVEASGDGMFEADLLSGHGKVSAGWAKMLGYVESEVERWEMTLYVHPDDLDAVAHEYAAHLRGETPHTHSEMRMRCKDGAYKWVLSRARLVSRTPDGTPARIVGTIMDISTRKALERQLEVAKDEAERANAAKGIFVANMSHEIRTPLNGVVAIAGVLAATPLTAEQQEMVALVRSSAEVLERMLTDVLDQSKLEAGQFEQQIAPFDLKQTIQSASELMRARAQEKGLAFHVVISETADGLFEGDAVRLRQVISNLASNAVKFTERGEVNIAVEAAEAGGQQSGLTDLTLTVSDTGIGFDAAEAERLFDRFAQADGSISRRFGGTGLGLAISKSLVELMGGDLRAESQPGIGSVFTMTLSLPRAAANRHYEEATKIDDATTLFGLRVLLAEDHPTNQRVVQLILDPFGVELTIVNDGRKAVEALELAGVGSFDLVLMDMQMPVLDGLAATREIRRLEAASGRRPVPIAMLTANAMNQHLELAVAAGCNSHIAKPVTPESLVSGIAKLLSGGVVVLENPLQRVG